MCVFGDRCSPTVGLFVNNSVCMVKSRYKWRQRKFNWTSVITDSCDDRFSCIILSWRSLRSPNVVRMASVRSAWTNSRQSMRIIEAGLIWNVRKEVRIGRHATPETGSDPLRSTCISMVLYVANTKPVNLRLRRLRGSKEQFAWMTAFRWLKWS